MKPAQNFLFNTAVRQLAYTDKRFHYAGNYRHLYVLSKIYKQFTRSKHRVHPGYALTHAAPEHLFTDLFCIFLELLGAREKGIRLTMLVPEEKGMLATITRDIAEMDGNIISLGTFVGEDPTNRLIAVKVSEVGQDELVSAMEALGMEIVDARVA